MQRCHDPGNPRTHRELRLSRGRAPEHLAPKPVQVLRQSERRQQGERRVRFDQRPEISGASMFEHPAEDDGVSHVDGCVGVEIPEQVREGAVGEAGYHTPKLRTPRAGGSEGLQVARVAPEELGQRQREPGQRCAAVEDSVAVDALRSGWGYHDRGLAL